MYRLLHTMAFLTVSAKTWAMLDARYTLGIKVHLACHVAINHVNHILNIMLLDMLVNVIIMSRGRDANSHHASCD